MKKALILGIGPAQIDAIRYLKDAGWWVVGCGYPREGPGLSLVDRFELIDIADIDALHALGRREGIDLVYSIGSDLAMPSVAAVARQLGLPSFISQKTAELLQDKTSLRAFLANAGLSPVKFLKVLGEPDLRDWDSFPAMVKPSDSQGQRGIFRVDSYPEMTARLANARSFSRRGTVIVEEFLDGPEISANVFLADGRVVVKEISDRLVVRDLYCGIPRGHVLPSQACQGDLRRETEDLVERCVKALGIANGPVYFQMKITSAGPRVVEITPRLDGCHIWRLIKVTRNVDLLDASFRWLSGAALTDLKAREVSKPARLMFFLARPGEVFQSTAHRPPTDAVHAEYYLQEGQAVPRLDGNLEKVGYYIAWGAQ